MPSLHCESHTDSVYMQCKQCVYCTHSQGKSSMLTLCTLRPPSVSGFRPDTPRIISGRVECWHCLYHAQCKLQHSNTTEGPGSLTIFSSPRSSSLRSSSDLPGAVHVRHASSERTLVKIEFSLPCSSFVCVSVVSLSGHRTRPLLACQK